MVMSNDTIAITTMMTKKKESFEKKEIPNIGRGAGYVGIYFLNGVVG
jgi:hypothetical protein